MVLSIVDGSFQELWGHFAQFLWLSASAASSTVTSSSYLLISLLACHRALRA
jgi:hypothetical protein